MKSKLDFVKEIEELKPDMKPFWKEIDASNARITFSNLLSDPFSVLHLFKIELLYLYIETHSNLYVYSETNEELYNYLITNDIDPKGFVKKRKSYYGDIYNYVSDTALLENDTLSTKLILGNLTDPKQYCNTYLKRKINPTNGTTAYSKKLEENAMSLAVFKQWLTTVKPLNSVQAEDFISQIIRYDTPLKTQFFEAIMDHCAKPSIKLQKYIRENYLSSDKYQVLPERYKFRNSAKYKLTFSTTWDSQDFSFKPFITNVNRKEIDNKLDLEDTLSNAIILLQQSDYSELMYNELIEYAKTAKPELITDYKSNIKLAHDALTKILKDF